jgi:hypothetical protein
MTITDLKKIISTGDIDLIISKTKLYSNKNNILYHFFNELGIKGTNQNVYLNNFDLVKFEELAFRQACLNYINELILNIHYSELDTYIKSFI